VITNVSPGRSRPSALSNLGRPASFPVALVDVDLVAPGHLEHVTLAVSVLVAGRHTAVADTGLGYDVVPGTGRVLTGDARRLAVGELAPCHFLIMSPPSVNRMSYIRELRRTCTSCATCGRPARRASWPSAAPGGGDLARRGLGSRRHGIAGGYGAGRRLRAIRRDGGRTGPLLANYVAKYFHDMSRHLQAASGHVRAGGEVTYIIGNSASTGTLCRPRSGTPRCCARPGSAG